MIIPKFRARVASDCLPERIRLYDADVNKFHTYMDSLRDGTHVFVTIKKITRETLRSVEQNRYYWGIVIKLLADYTGYTKEEMHEALKYKFLRYENVPGLPTVLSTTQLSTVEFESYLEQVRRWAAIEFGVYIPLPREVEEG